MASSLEDAIDAVARAEGFSGAIRVDVGDDVALRRAHGLADRAHSVPNTIDTRFAIASATKGLTALTVVSLVVDGALSMATTARSILGPDLPLIDDRVTIEHLLAHRSGIGDYIDEESGADITDHILPVPVHELDCTEAYVRVLDGFPQRFGPGERFSYCNSGFVVLALLAERVSGTPFAELVQDRVCRPACMTSSSFLRSDELPGDAAVGYLGADHGYRTNVFHLPVIGSGDGGLYSTIADVHRFWPAVMSGDVVPIEWIEEMVRPRSHLNDGSMRYGLGFWLTPTGPGVLLEGYDAGVSFRSMHDPDRRVTWTVVSNTSDGAWPLARALAEQIPA